MVAEIVQFFEAELPYRFLDEGDERLLGQFLPRLEPVQFQDMATICVVAKVENGF